jgi:hypothetical protein
MNACACVSILSAGDAGEVQREKHACMCERNCECMRVDTARLRLAACGYAIGLCAMLPLSAHEAQDSRVGCCGRLCVACTASSVRLCLWAHTLGHVWRCRPRRRRNGSNPTHRRCVLLCRNCTAALMGACRNCSASIRRACLWLSTGTVHPQVGRHSTRSAGAEHYALFQGTRACAPTAHVDQCFLSLALILWLCRADDRARALACITQRYALIPASCGGRRRRRTSAIFWPAPASAHPARSEPSRH